MKHYLLHAITTASFLLVPIVLADDHVMTATEIDQLAEELSNWGRWGVDDEMGTLNLITANTRKAAASLVEHGVSVSMAQDSDTNPWAVDKIGVRFHGLVHSHIDALCHYHYKGRY